MERIKCTIDHITYQNLGIDALSIGYEAQGGSHTPKPRKQDYYKVDK